MVPRRRKAALETKEGKRTWIMTSNIKKREAKESMGTPKREKHKKHQGAEELEKLLS